MRWFDLSRAGLASTTNALKNRLTWGTTYTWKKDGDEWNGQAALCGVPYDVWKESLVKTLIDPHVTNQTHVLEIAPGHGRWTEHLVGRAARVTAVDISPSCVDYCRNRFKAHDNVEFILTSGNSLPGDLTDHIGFVWSFDSFVHMDKHIIEAYLGEIRRVLRPDGSAIIHHSNVAEPGKHRQSKAPGWRSAMSASLMKEMGEGAGLSVISQFVYWDSASKIGVPRYGDRITHLARNP